MSTRKGSLEVICGPMFSGKSEELIRRLRRAKIAQQQVIVFKHSLDDRHTLEYVVSHNGSKLDSIPVKNPATMLDRSLKHSMQVVGIDEVQFFDATIVSTICTLIEAGKRVIVAGLDLDFRGAPFGSMPLLMAIADHIIKLQAICTLCGLDATFTQRLVDGRPAKHHDPIVMVGAQEAYQARCRQCHIIDKQPSFYHQHSL
jgi:thymidine kinase